MKNSGNLLLIKPKNELKYILHTIDDIYEYVVNYLKSSYIEKDKNYHKVTSFMKLSDIIEKGDLNSVFKKINNFDDILTKTIKNNLNIKDKNKTLIIKDYIKKSVLKLIYFDYLKQLEDNKNYKKIEYMVSSILNSKETRAIKEELKNFIKKFEDFCFDQMCKCDYNTYYHPFKLKGKQYNPVGVTFIDSLLELGNLVDKFDKQINSKFKEFIKILEKNSFKDVDIEYFKMYKQIYINDKIINPLKIYINRKIRESNTYFSTSMILDGLMYTGETIKEFRLLLDENFLKFENNKIIQDPRYKKSIESLLLFVKENKNKRTNIINLKK